MLDPALFSLQPFFDACWRHEYMPGSRTLDQHIAQTPRTPKSSRRCTARGTGMTESDAIRPFREQILIARRHKHAQA